MPMKNQGSVPQGKGQKKANEQKDKNTTRELKGLVAQEHEKEQGKSKNDPRDTGK